MLKMTSKHYLGSVMSRDIHQKICGPTRSVNLVNQAAYRGVESDVAPRKIARGLLRPTQSASPPLLLTDHSC
jgi:hypothetical protein